MGNKVNAPKAKLFAMKFTNPKSDTFGSIRESWLYVNSKCGNANLKYTDVYAAKFIRRKDVQEEINRQLRNNMKQYEFNLGNIISTLKPHLESDNTAEALKAKEILLKHWGELTKLGLKYGYLKEDETLNDLSNEQLVERVQNIYEELQKSSINALEEPKK